MTGLMALFFGGLVNVRRYLLLQDQRFMENSARKVFLVGLIRFDLEYVCVEREDLGFHVLEE